MLADYYTYTAALGFFLFADEDTRRELHEMLVPAVLKEPWSKAEDYVYLTSYFVKFRPLPPDRDYKPFGLYVKVSLPGEAERMKLDLHLARGRSVVTELIPSRTMLFSRDEVSKNGLKELNL